MASKNKTSSGLRFIWIPGRKKHQHKGRYETTNKQPNYGRPQNRPNEPWALGGSKGHKELTKADHADDEGVSAGSCTTALAMPAASTAVLATTTTTATTNDDPNHADDGDERGAAAAPSCEPGKTPETHFGPEDEGATMYPPDLHNTATLLISDRKNGAIRKKPRSGDLDSIDRLEEDCLDAVKLRNGTTIIKGHTYQTEPVEEKDHEKTVTCLYYTLQCCECTIS